MKEASTVSTVDLAGLSWRKSSRSTSTGADGNCVEIAFAGPAVAVRDSKNPDAALAVPVAAFAALLGSI
jgi:hypothetical protein